MVEQIRGWTDEQLAQALKNVGVSMDCGTCMEVFSTGSSSGHPHSCGDKPVPPLRRFILGNEGWWIPLGEDNRSYPSHRHDAEAMLHGLNPGVVIGIWAPGDNTAYEPEEA